MTTEKQTGFTPGPWVATGSLAIRTHDGATLANVRWDDFYASDDIGERPYRDEEQAKANARLIAAAPELLEALEEVLPDGVTIRDDTFDAEGWLAKARAAIAKVRGAA